MKTGYLVVKINYAVLLTKSLGMSPWKRWQETAGRLIQGRVEGLQKVNLSSKQEKRENYLKKHF